MTKRYRIKLDALGDPLIIDTHDGHVVIHYVVTSDTPNAHKNANDHADRLNRVEEEFQRKVADLPGKS